LSTILFHFYQRSSNPMNFGS